jgi:hypothetical protein
MIPSILLKAIRTRVKAAIDVIILECDQLEPAVQSQRNQGKRLDRALQELTLAAVDLDTIIARDEPLDSK